METIVVHGPPCSGKSTYVAEHLEPGDIRYDYDILVRALSGQKTHSANSASNVRGLVFGLRRRIINLALEGQLDTEHLYIISTSLPEPLRKDLEPLTPTYVQMEATEEECMERLAGDDTHEDKDAWAALIREWFQRQNTEVTKMFQISKVAGALKAAPDDVTMSEINEYTRTPLSPEDVYVFSVRACDDQPDRVAERFTADCLRALASLFLGKTVICDHSWSAGNQMARIFRAQVVADGGATYLKLTAYMLRNAETQPVIDKIDAGILKEVSVGCAIAKTTCSICGEPYSTCSHMRGRVYDGNQCIVELSEPTDAYEVSFVAVPAQPAAGVCKGASLDHNNMSTLSLDAAKQRLRLEKNRFGG